MASALKLSTREQRKKLPARPEPYYFEVRRGLHLGYRKGGGAKAGSWLLREFKPDASLPRGGQYSKRRLGTADDVTQSDGVSVLNWAEALKLATGEERPTVTIPGRLLVSDAADAYFLTKGNESGQDAYTYETFIAPRFANRPINEITTGEIESWLASQVTTKGGNTKQGGVRELPAGDDREVRRRGQATANRRYAVLRAILNSAYRKDPARVPSPDAWRRVRPFPKADKPRLRVVQVDEAVRLLAALPPDVSVLARGALYTGMRLGELTALKVEDVSGSTVTVQHGKGRGGGKMRVIPLTEEGREFFAGLCEGKKRADAVFVPVYRVKLSRAFAEACETAEIDPPVTMHDMRRSYGSLLINSGAPADIIQELLGHADLRMTRRVYAHLLQSTLKAAVDKHLPSFTGKAKPQAADSVSKPAKRRKRATKTT